jgi:MYXO-CTERM domain-containing protein
MKSWVGSWMSFVVATAAVVTVGCADESAEGPVATTRAALVDGEPTFEDVTDDAGFTVDNSSWGAAWADYDDDGDSDVFVYGHLPHQTCARSQLMRNNGNGTFTDVTVAADFASDGGDDTAFEGDPDVCTDPSPETCASCANIDTQTPEETDAYDQGDTHGAVWLDFNRDGKKDLYVINGSTKFEDGGPNEQQFNRLWLNDGDGTFTNISETAGTRGQDHRGRGVYSFDFENDGKIDIFSTAYDRGPYDYGNLLFHNNGDNTFDDLGGTSGIARDSDQNRAAGWADYDNDGLVDVIVAEPCALYHHELDGTFTEVTVDAGILANETCTGFAWGDIDDDGFIDLYSSQGFDSQIKDILYRNNGNGSFSDVTITAGVSNLASTRGAIFGDYDNDADLDLYVVNLQQASKPNQLYQNDGTGTFTEVGGTEGAGGLPENPVAGACGIFVDFNKDGHLDIFTTNGEGNTSAPYLLLKNRANDNHWLEIVLIGTDSNIDGLGAKLSVKTGSKTQLRQHLGPHHWLSQSLLPVHFGLGTATSIDELVVTWPSGLVEEFSDVDIDQIVEITEGAGVVSTGGDGGAGGEGGGDVGGASAGGALSSGGNAGAMPGEGGSGDSGGNESSGGAPTTDGGMSSGGMTSSQGGADGASDGGASDGADAEDGGCGCSTPGKTPEHGALAALALGLSLFARRRRRSATFGA